ncbi:senescence-associated domain-containing protein [Rhodotorula paludigena]|uniref:senescence-associated domain-containing protein n=1 Tax=Rhodotorula paludigena TaxID=86838 RepID=UPI003172C708
MQHTRTPLVTVPHATLAHVETGDETVLFSGNVTLSICREQQRTRTSSPAGTPRKLPPPPLPSRPGQPDAAPPSYSSATLAPPPAASTSTLAGGAEWLSLTLTLEGDAEPAFEMPVSLANVSSSITASPPSSYLLPNRTGADPASLAFLDSSASDSKGTPAPTTSSIRVTLPPDTDGETRETFEAALYGLYRGPPSGRLSAPGSAGGSGSVTPVQTEPNSLYLVDEDSGRVVGQLAGPGDAHGLRLEEDAALQQGEVHDAPGSTASARAKVNDVAAHEPVVIDALAVAGAGQAGESSVATVDAQGFSVTPVSHYQPAENPQNSKVIATANLVSRGIIVGSRLLAAQMERGAGRYVASRPATTTPMVFKESTKGAFDRSSRWTQQATVYSGKAAGAVGNMAAKVGDRIGKAAGIQSQPGGPPPTGWKSTLASTLTAVSTLADHLETGGKTLLDSSTKSASQVIHHKYGAEARGVADDLGSSVKHVAVVYIDARGVTRKALLKGVGKGAIRARMADGSEVILSDSNGELKRIEDVALGNGNRALAIEAVPDPAASSSDSAAAAPPAYAAGGAGAVSARGGSGYGTEKKGL